MAISGGFVIPGKGNDMAERNACSVPDCEKPLRSSGSEWCAMHYHRVYRHGSVDKVDSAVPSVSLGRRYTREYLPRHPLANKSGQVYTHRLVLFNEIGPGPHACHWCGTYIDWLPKGHPRELQPDHLNNDGGDNRPENLVPSCRPCNISRGSQRRQDALREQGFWSNHDTVAALGPRKPRVA